MSDPIQKRLQRVLAQAEAVVPSGASTGRLQRQCEVMTDEALEGLARDRAADAAVRARALTVFVARHRLEPEASALLLDLLDDPEEGVVLAAIAEAPAFVAALRDRLRQMLDDPRPARAHAAARALARRKDRAIVPVLLSWLAASQGIERRLAALSGLRWLLEPAEALAVFGTAWDAAEAAARLPDAEGIRLRLAVAEALVALGDDRPLESLAALALDGGPGASEALCLIAAFDAQHPGEPR